MKKMLLFFLLASMNAVAQNYLPINSDASGSSINLTGRNLDTLTAVGFYRGTSMVNAPGVGWWFILVESHTNSRGADGWTKQTVTAYGAGNTFPAGTTFTRNQTGGIAWTPWVMALYANGSGNVGLGTTNPAYKLDVNGTAYVSGSTISVGQITAMNGSRLKATSGSGVQVSGASTVSMRGVGTSTSSGYAAIQTAYDNINFLCPLTLQDQGGNVLIGKTTQTNTSYKLDVAGNIRANKLVVNTNGADFVFESGYHLLSLDSVETFVNKNHRLPGIAAAADMQKEGIEVGESQSKLLQKIEELTLYIIEQNKQILQQSKELTDVKKRLTDMEIKQLK